MQYRTVLVVAITCLVATSLLLGGVSHSVAADSTYEITIDGSVDTPTREVDLQGATYEVSAIAKAETGDSLDVSVRSTETDQEYQVYLYNSDKQIIKGNSGTGDETVTFDLSGLDAGTYMFAVQEQGANRVIHPLVIKGYETSIDAPTSATVGDEVTVDITVDQLREDVTRDRIEVVIANDEHQIRETIEQDSDTPTFSINTDRLDAGSYEVYANIRGENVVFDQQEILGVSDGQLLKLEASDTSTPSSGDGGVGGGGSATSTSSATDTPESTSSATDTPESTSSVTDTAETIGSTETTSDGDTTSDSNTETNSNGESDTDSGDESTNVMTPNGQSSPNTDTTIPGFDLSLIGTLLILATTISILIRQFE